MQAAADLTGATCANLLPFPLPDTAAPRLNVVRLKDRQLLSPFEQQVIAEFRDSHGRGGHGSMPSATIDPIVMGAHIVSDVQTVISREKDAAAFGVITVGSFQAGTVDNIIPD